MSTPEEQIIKQIEKKQEIIFNIIKNEKDFSTILNKLGDSEESKKLKQNNKRLKELVTEAITIQKAADADSSSLIGCLREENPNSKCLPEAEDNEEEEEDNDEDIF